MCKHFWFLSLAIALEISGSSSTFINVPDHYYVAFIPHNEPCYEPAEISTTQVVVVPVPVILSTGPIIMKARTSSDCYEIPYVNSNGTLPAATWVRCPL